MTKQAWAWLSMGRFLLSYGNGSGQFQYPVFYSRREARDWAKRVCGEPRKLTKLVKVTIRVPRASTCAERKP